MITFPAWIFSKKNCNFHKVKSMVYHKINGLKIFKIFINWSWKIVSIAFNVGFFIRKKDKWVFRTDIVLNVPNFSEDNNWDGSILSCQGNQLSRMKEEGWMLALVTAFLIDGTGSQWFSIFSPLKYSFLLSTVFLAGNFIIKNIKNCSSRFCVKKHFNLHTV